MTKKKDMSLASFEKALEKVFPSFGSVNFEYDDDGQLIIYTGMQTYHTEDDPTSRLEPFVCDGGDSDE